MSKRSKKQMTFQPGQRANAPAGISRRGAVRDSVREGNRNSPTKGSDKEAANPQKGSAQAYATTTRTVEQMTTGIRVLGFAVALLSLAGALYWAGSRNGVYPPGVLAGLVALGFLAGFGLFIAIRAKEIAVRAKRD